MQCAPDATRIQDLVSSWSSARFFIAYKNAIGLLRIVPSNQVWDSIILCSIARKLPHDSAHTFLRCLVHSLGRFLWLSDSPAHSSSNSMLFRLCEASSSASLACVCALCMPAPEMEQCSQHFSNVATTVEVLFNVVHDVVSRDFKVTCLLAGTNTMIIDF